MTTGAIPIVDAHVHLWDRGLIPYPWLDQPNTANIASNYGLPDYRSEFAGWPVRGFVHVEAGADPNYSELETEWLQGMSAREGQPDAIVARVALDSPDVERRLAWQAARAKVRGIRHLVNWHPEAVRQAYPVDLTADPAWQQGYALLGDFGLSFDFHGFPPQLGNLAEVAARNERVPLIINHLGLPILEDGLDQWRRGLRALASLPHAAIKLSGAGFVAAPFDLSHFADIVLEVIHLFGPSRVMVASNFPTDRLFASLETTFSAYQAILAPFSEADRRAMWGGNANRIYRLGLAL